MSVGTLVRGVVSEARYVEVSITEISETGEYKYTAYGKAYVYDVYDDIIGTYKLSQKVEITESGYARPDGLADITWN